MGLYWNIFSLLHEKENIENHIVFPGFEGHLIRSYAERRVPNKIVQGISSPLFASILEVQISNTMSGEWQGYVRCMVISYVYSHTLLQIYSLTLWICSDPFAPFVLGLYLAFRSHLDHLIIPCCSIRECWVFRVRLLEQQTPDNLSSRKGMRE